MQKKSGYLIVCEKNKRKKKRHLIMCVHKAKDPPLHSLKLHDHPFLAASQLSESISHLFLYQVGICGHINFPGLIGFLHMILDMALCFHSLSY